MLYLIKYISIISLLFTCQVLLGQKYSKDYIVASFNKNDWDDLQTGKIDPKSIQNLYIENPGSQVISNYSVNKLQNLKMLYLEGNDVDLYLSVVPVEFLEIKSLKVIFLERIENLWKVVSSIRKQRPDIEIKFMNDDPMIKCIYSYINKEDSYPGKVKVVYPKEAIFPYSFEVDSIFRKEKKNTLDYLLLAESFVNYKINWNYQNFNFLRMCDSVYSLQGELALKNFQYNYTNSVSMIDTARALGYLDQAIESNGKDNWVLFCIGYFYRVNMKDRNKACSYFEKVQGVSLSDWTYINSQYNRILNIGIYYNHLEIHDYCNKKKL